MSEECEASESLLPPSDAELVDLESVSAVLFESTLIRDMGFKRSPEEKEVEMGLSFVFVVVLILLDRQAVHAIEALLRFVCLFFCLFFCLFLCFRQVPTEKKIEHRDPSSHASPPQDRHSTDTG